MTAPKRFMVCNVVRTPEVGPEDRIDFKEGVNVVVGPPNTGKTKWFQMLDYVLGNDGVAENVFGEDVAEKYEAITAPLLVAGEEMKVQRRWKEAGAEGKVFLNGESMAVKDFLHDLLSRLSIPILTSGSKPIRRLARYSHLSHRNRGDNSEFVNPLPGFLHGLERSMNLAVTQNVVV